MSKLHKVISHLDHDQVLVASNFAIDWDLTLLKLGDPVEFNDYISPACFMSETEIFLSKEVWLLDFIMHCLLNVISLLTEVYC